MAIFYHAFDSGKKNDEVELIFQFSSSSECAGLSVSSPSFFFFFFSALIIGHSFRERNELEHFFCLIVLTMELWNSHLNH